MLRGVPPEGGVRTENTGREGEGPMDLHERQENVLVPPDKCISGREHTGARPVHESSVREVAEQRLKRFP